MCFFGCKIKHKLQNVQTFPVSYGIICVTLRHERKCRTRGNARGSRSAPHSGATAGARSAGRDGHRLLAGRRLRGSPHGGPLDALPHAADVRRRPPLHTIDDGSRQRKYCLCHNTHRCRPDELHCHFHCLRCDHTFCLPTVNIPAVDIPEGFTVNESEYVLHGFCPRCRRALSGK